MVNEEGIDRQKERKKKQTKVKEKKEHKGTDKISASKHKVMGAI